MTATDDLYEQLEALEQANAYTPIAHTCGYLLKKIEVPRPDYVSKHYYDSAKLEEGEIVSCPQCDMFLSPTEQIEGPVAQAGTKRVYKGWIRLRAEIGDGPDDILFLSPDESKEWLDAKDTLARQIEDDIKEHGRYLSVQYYIAAKKLSKKHLQTEWLNRLEGIGIAEYDVHWSDITGYLWTDEELKVGGHDLLEELKSHPDKYCHLEIWYNKSPLQEEGGRSHANDAH